MHLDFCRGKPDGEHPHPVSCTQFIHCANSVPHLKSCPEPDKLVFDPNLRVCVWKKDYYCVDKGSGGSGGGHGGNWGSAAASLYMQKGVLALIVASSFLLLQWH